MLDVSSTFALEQQHQQQGWLHVPLEPSRVATRSDTMMLVDVKGCVGGSDTGQEQLQLNSTILDWIDSM